MVASPRPGAPSRATGKNMTAQLPEGSLWVVIVTETELSVTVRAVGAEEDDSETRRATYHIPARTPREPQNVVANRIHRAMLGFPQDPEHEGGRQ